MSVQNVVSVSGGKDSTATLLLAQAWEVENITAVFADTGNEIPVTYEYIEYLQDATGIPITKVKANFDFEINRRREKLAAGELPGWTDSAIESALQVLHPTGNPFLDLCLWKGRFPSSQAQFCTSELKVKPIQEQIFYPLLAEGQIIWSWQGIRRNESARRANAKEFESLGGDLYAYRPIARWTAADTFEAMAYMGIEPNPLYKQGCNRVGCLCINSAKNELASLAARFPEEVQRVMAWEALVSAASRRGSTTFFVASNDPTVIASDKVHYSTHGIARMVEWANTGKGGRQRTMFDELPACKSAYGLCE